MFLMSSPELVSIDLDILRQVLVRNFDCFTDRTNLLNVDPTDQTSLLATSLVSLKGLHWFNVRSLVAPAFSTGKIRLVRLAIRLECIISSRASPYCSTGLFQMVPIFNECSKICIAIIEKYALDGRPVPIKDVITRLTLDMTARCAFGYDFNVQHNTESPFIKFAQKFSEMDLRSPEIA
ncbi:hypothetical protein OSTOST_12960, partial [Ostertagia ostertagi]